MNVIDEANKVEITEVVQINKDRCKKYSGNSIQAMVSIEKTTQGTTAVSQDATHFMCMILF